MTLEERKLYLSIIEEIYGSGMRAQESQITEEVADIVDTMLQEIRLCSVRLGIFHAIVEGVVEGLGDAFEGLGVKMPPNKIHFVETELRNKSKASISSIFVDFGYYFTLEFVRVWLGILNGYRQSHPCVNSAALNWKSPLAIALMGL